MTSGNYPPSNPDPSAAYPPPTGGSYVPPSGAYPPPAGGSYPPPGSAAYPPPSDSSYPPPAGGAYPPPAGGAYPTGQPGAFPPPGAPVPKPKSRARLITLVVVLVVLIGGGITAYLYSRKHDTALAAVGSCIQVKSATVVDADTNQIACSDPAAAYIVTETGDSSLTCDSHEATYTQTKGSSVETTVCLRPNLAVGDCWKESIGDQAGTKYPGCTGVPAADKSDTSKVLKVDTTTSDQSTCPDATTSYLSIPKRTVVYCFADLS